MTRVGSSARDAPRQFAHTVDERVRSLVSVADDKTSQVEFPDRVLTQRPSVNAALLCQRCQCELVGSGRRVDHQMQSCCGTGHGPVGLARGERAHQAVTRRAVSRAHPADVAIHLCARQEVRQRGLHPDAGGDVGRVPGVGDGRDEALGEHEPSDPQRRRQRLGDTAAVHHGVRPETLEGPGQRAGPRATACCPRGGPHC
jgi:hypothetical protein